MTDQELAVMIAGLLEPRDDIATADIDPEDPTLVLVTTQGGTPFVVYVEASLRPEVMGDPSMGEEPQQG